MIAVPLGTALAAASSLAPRHKNDVVQLGDRYAKIVITERGQLSWEAFGPPWRGTEALAWLMRYGLLCAAQLRTSQNGQKRMTWAKQILGYTAGYQPSWLGMPELHARHRAFLLRDDPAWYGQLNWREQMEVVGLTPSLELPEHREPELRL